MEKDKENIQEEIISDNESENLDEINLENSDEKNHKKNEENEDILDSNSEETEDENLKEVEVEETEEDKFKKEIRILKEEKIRVLAEMENLRKRFDREKIDSIKYGSVNFARDILSPGDNLERALSSIKKDEEHSQSIKNLIDGLLMVKKELLSALEKNGIVKIDTLNKKFDPNLHQAMMEIENNDLEEGIVVQEIQTGYMMHDRLLRPAMVGVSRKSKKKSKKDSDHNLSSDKGDSKKDTKN